MSLHTGTFYENLYTLDALHAALPSTMAHCAAGEASPSIFQHFCAAVLIALLIFARAVKR